MSKREPKLTSAERIQIQYRYSSALHRVGCSLEYLRKDIDRDPRKVIPVAALARKFDISTRLLWKWIHDGLIVKKQRTQPGQKQGVTKSAALSFLKRLTAEVDFAGDALSYRGELWDMLPRDRFRADLESRAGRPDTAKRKIREARRNGVDGQGMNPRQFADAVGVSRSAVWRAIESRELEAWNPTPHRTLIGSRPRTSKKVGKRQKKSLTRKNR